MTVFISFSEVSLYICIGEVCRVLASGGGHQDVRQYHRDTGKHRGLLQLCDQDTGSQEGMLNFFRLLVYFLEPQILLVCGTDI